MKDDEREPGIYSVNWDGKAENGVPVAGGVYISRLSAPTHTARKLVSLHRAEVPAPTGAEVFTATKKMVLPR